MDTILGILLGESYSGIRDLEDLSMCVNKYQQVACLCVVMQYICNTTFINTDCVRSYLSLHGISELLLLGYTSLGSLRGLVKGKLGLTNRTNPSWSIWIGFFLHRVGGKVSFDNFIEFNQSGL